MIFNIQSQLHTVPRHLVRRPEDVDRLQLPDLQHYPRRGAGRIHNRADLAALCHRTNADPARIQVHRRAERSRCFSTGQDARSFPAQRSWGVFIHRVHDWLRPVRRPFLVPKGYVRPSPERYVAVANTLFGQNLLGQGTFVEISSVEPKFSFYCQTFSCAPDCPVTASIRSTWASSTRLAALSPPRKATTSTSIRILFRPAISEMCSVKPARRLATASSGRSVPARRWAASLRRFYFRHVLDREWGILLWLPHIIFESGLAMANCFKRLLSHRFIIGWRIPMMRPTKHRCWPPRNQEASTWTTIERTPSGCASNCNQLVAFSFYLWSTPSISV